MNFDAPLDKRSRIYRIQIEDDVEFNLKEGIVSISYKGITESKKLSNFSVSINYNDSERLVTIKALKRAKRAAAIAKTFFKIITNLINDLVEPKVTYMILYYKHFNSSFKVEGNQVIVKNFIGAKKDVYLDLKEGIEAVDQGKNILKLTGTNRERVGHTVNNLINIRRRNNILNLDLRFISDGFYVLNDDEVEKAFT